MHTSPPSASSPHSSPPTHPAAPSASTQRPTLIVTGAAAGIGRAVAERFLAAGWFVGLYDVDEDGVRALHEHWGPDRSVAGRLDVTSPQDWSAALELFERAAGSRLDVLFNNAGIAISRPFEDADLERHSRLVDVNLKGVINGCHLSLPLLKKAAGGRVINMCSASALYGQPDLATYAATKAAVRSLTEALDIEWRRHAIRVVDVLPLFVNTAMVANEISRMKTVSALGVRLSPEDIANTVWRLATRPAGRLPTHSFVGMQTQVLALLSKLSPDSINRWVTARMAGY